MVVRHSYAIYFFLFYQSKQQTLDSFSSHDCLLLYLCQKPEQEIVQNVN